MNFEDFLLGPRTEAIEDEIDGYKGKIRNGRSKNILFFRYQT